MFTRCYMPSSKQLKSVKLDDELKNRVKDLANARQRSAHWIMREAISDYVDREEKREALRRDALKAWSAFQRNGKHLKMEEADAWLAKLESGEDTEIHQRANGASPFVFHLSSFIPRWAAQRH